MSSYKSYTPRRPAESTDTPSNDKLKDKVAKLQELFPNWSNEDLQSVLVETSGDVELAVARISEGHAEQWGSVSRKREKRNTQTSQSGSSHRDRPSDSRGGRGGRGGRGRGGGGRGASRSSPGSHHPRTIANTTSGINGSNPHLTEPTTVVNDGSTLANGSSAGAGEPSSNANDFSEDLVDVKTVAPEPEPVPSSKPDFTTEALLTPVKAAASTTAPVQNGSSLTNVSVTKMSLKTSKIPAGAKMSWAQIARAQEKPKPVSPPPPTVQPPAPVPASTAVESVPTVTEESQPQQEPEWEEPTTVEPPIWDDEPPAAVPPPTQVTEIQVSTSDGWITAESVPTATIVKETWESNAFTGTKPDASMQDSTWSQTQPDETSSASSPQVTTPSLASLAPTALAPSVTTSTAPTSKPSTPSVSHARPVSIHRASARYPKSDQAVVIPAFAGNIGTPGERMGMQFGSLSIGGDDTLDGPFKNETEQPSETQPMPSLTPQSQAPVQTQPQDVAPSPAVPVSGHIQTAPFFQQQQTSPSSSVQQPHAQAPQQASHAASQNAPSVATFSHPPPPVLTHQQQQQQLAQQHHQQQQTQHSYAQQHGIHAHFDGPPAAQQQQQPQHAAGPQSASYFRQADSPYYHTPTPPQSAPPEHQGYGAFSPLGGTHGHAQGLGGQVAGHLGGFGAGGPGEYGYGDQQRGFYDYGQQSGFSNRLGHNDEPSKTGLPISQGNQPTSGLGSAAGQPQASTGPQGSSGQPPAGQQGQQGYPAPMPYYYPPYFQPPSSYPTYPNPSYSQAYLPKYPPVYPHQAPVGPGSAPPPAGKGPGATAPYNPSASQSHLYHSQGGFEDPTAGYQHHQGSGNLGAADYQKSAPHHQQQQPLYGTQAGQGLQSFLGIQQGAGGGQGGPASSQQRSGTSPETAYKPYGTPGGASDKSGVGISAQPGQQGRGGGVQQTQQAGNATSFYPGGRFGGGAGGPQQGQQQGQAYPQSGDQGQFYSYQPRHQGGYWQ